MVASGRALFLAVLLLASAVPLAATTTKSVLAAQLDGVPPAASVRSEPAAVEAPTAGTQGAADWRSKVDASLLAAGDPAEVVTVFVASTDLAAVHRLLGRPVPSETASRLRVPVLEVPRFLLPKVAALPGILAVWPYHIPPQPTAPDDLYSPFRTSPDPQPAMRDVVAIQGASLAWADGFTGQGTRVLVMDTGVDFGHPDLNGTQARVTDLASPYFGWPIAFDSLSMNAWLFWGGAYPAANTWFADTNATDVDADANGTLDATGLNVTGIPSASGVFHYGQHPDQRLQNRVGANVTVLVTDSLAPGAYDTVYTDLDNDEDLSDEWPARRGDEVATRDVTGDGLADRSAGMVYFVADGVTPLPYSDVIAAEYLLPNRIPANGGLVAFAINDATESGGAHGTLCASAVVAQGVISGGVVTGMAPDAKIITTGNVYNGGNFLDYYFFAAEGYDGVPGTGDEAHILSGSFGDSWVVERGWEFEARLVDNITANYARELTFIIAAGNGGFGYGTVVTPGATPGVITAGAATSFRRPDGASYSTWGDVIPWSDRGPSPFGQLDPDVVSVGATASGDVTVNEAGNGNNAWGYWSGTSLATPVTAGAAALVHQAYRQARAANPEGLEMRDLLMSTADDLAYDVFVQGAGLVNASRATKAAAQTGGLWASPGLWQAG
ncbi:MAG TPA: S8 family serine peptidase, partial [Thermoplasmata archaeon]|nr:S8 family serine peptidase [Thermoplasmata archaeon]